ncbi:hypothetical protein IGI04_022594 [Brassica rapa subsp. trilocularis]|uniref:Uncharacterized protein n=1 Tax=Brassica rapa subsp. trilocularis TaxID=1813537 RepID=A0ABQ7M5L2_BRACM|nr:hypothetical protein IGI04_022594 [Brassica rapa subsp. trilocularis]
MTFLLSHPHHLQVITRLPLSVTEANDYGWVTFVCDSVCLEKPYICSSDDLLGKSSGCRRLTWKSSGCRRLTWKSSGQRREVQTTSKKSRRLPGSSDDFVRRLLGSSDDFQTTLQEVQTTFKKSRRLLDDFQTTSRRLTIRTLYNKKLPNEEKSDIRTYQNAQKNPDDFLEVQTTSWKSRRLPGSPDDFLEVQTTSWKSRRLCQKIPRSPDDFQTTNRENEWKIR